MAVYSLYWVWRCLWPKAVRHWPFLFAGIIAIFTAYAYSKLSLAYPDRGGTVDRMTGLLKVGSKRISGGLANADWTEEHFSQSGNLAGDVSRGWLSFLAGVSARFRLPARSATPAAKYLLY